MTLQGFGLVRFVRREPAMKGFPESSTRGQDWKAGESRLRVCFSAQMRWDVFVFFLMRKVGRASTKSVWVDVNFIVKSTKQQALVAQDCVCKAPGH